LDIFGHLYINETIVKDKSADSGKNPQQGFLPVLFCHDTPDRLFLAKGLTPLYNFQRPKSYGLAFQRFNVRPLRPISISISISEKRFNSSTVQQFNNSTIQRFNARSAINNSTRAAQSTIQQFNNSTIQQFNARSAINNSMPGNHIRS